MYGKLMSQNNSTVPERHPLYLRTHLSFKTQPRFHAFIYVTEQIILASRGNHTVNRGNGYETRQSSLLYVFVPFFALDRTQNTIVVYSVARN